MGKHTHTRTHKHPHTRAVTPLATPITEVSGVLINCGLRCYQRPQQQSRLKTDRVHRLSGQRGRRRKGREGKTGGEDGNTEEEGKEGGEERRGRN